MVWIAVSGFFVGDDSVHCLPLVSVLVCLLLVFGFLMQLDTGAKEGEAK